MVLSEMLLQLDLLMGRTSSGTSPFTKSRVQRGNTTSETAVLDHIQHPGTSAQNRKETLWIVDRILEPQTLAHFIEFCMHLRLPSGKKSTLSVVNEEDAMLIQQPYSSWVPPSFNNAHGDDVAIEKASICIGSFEDGDRLIPVSKELHAMKARIWEGIMPLSERRWKDLALDSPENFSSACQYFCAVINVFHYLNNSNVKAALRETYNRIWTHFKDFDDALNAKLAAESRPPVSITGLWHEYMSDLFTTISTRSHGWVTDHIHRLREPILEEFAALVAANPDMSTGGRQWELSNMIHDLAENTSQADSAIFLPMDGYKGQDVPAQNNDSVTPNLGPYREKPITFSSGTLARKADYYCRVKYLSRVEQWTGEGMQNKIPTAAVTAYSQATAQNKSRAELRGEPKPLEQDIWVQEAKARIGRHGNHEGSVFQWGYVAYRLCYDQSAEEWEAFKAKFETDISNWGSELTDVDEIKAISKVQWRDGRDMGIAEGDVEAAKRHFQGLCESDEAPQDVCDDMILVADKAVVDSYLNPESRQGGFVLAVDLHFDPANEEEERQDETPGYKGTVRVLGGLLWDDIAPMLLMQTQGPPELWPLAMHHPQQVYEGPLGYPRVV